MGRIELRATAPLWIDDLQAFPDLAAGTLRLHGALAQKPDHKGPSPNFTFELEDLTQHKKLKFGQAGTDYSIRFDPKPAFGTETTKAAPEATLPFQMELPLRNFTNTWDEFHPQLYRLTAKLVTDRKELCDSRTITFGLREVSTQGTQFLVNGRKTFFRGTLECAIFPRTGHPPTEIPEWKQIIRTAKAHGLNMLRFHSWCPPEAAFAAADELGFYFHIECSSWANQSVTIGDGKPVDAWIYAEADRILKAYGNHPSFLLLLYGNEPGGKKHPQFLARWVEHYRNRDSRRLVSAAAGWPQLPENQFQVTPDPRVQGWGEGLKSRINGKPPETTTDYRDYIHQRSVPVISHEIGQWCVYPNFAEMKKYTGYLKARNFEIFKDRLEANGMGTLAKPFLIASGKLQALCYKEDIESALRTPGMGGFQLLDLHDFPGQGTALVGVLDPFWEEKGYISPQEYHRFCNATVPLARLPQRVFTTNDKLTAQIEIARFGPEPLRNSVVEWKLVDSSRNVRARGEFPPQTIPVDNANKVGELSVDIKNFEEPEQCKLEVKLRNTDFANDWDIWVYPAPTQEAVNLKVLVTSQFDAAAQAHLSHGGNLLLTIPGAQVRNFDTAPVKLGFSSIFWNTAWTARQPPTTLGILCDPRHPALDEFPTDTHSNWQWWYLVHRAGALRLDLLPRGTEPVVRVIDDWVTARPLGLIVEGRVGAGRIIVCGFDLTRGADDPVSRQMRLSLTRYLESQPSRSAPQFTMEQIQSLMVEPRTGRLSGVRAVRASSAEAGFEAANALDGDPATLWHTPWGEGAPQLPHELVLEFDNPRMISGITALPRQDGNPNGSIKGYEIYVSADGKAWGAPVAQGEFSPDPSVKSVKFAAPMTTRFLKLRAVSSHAHGSWASLAELNVLTPEKR